MARIRTIKPEFWQDEKLARISRDARLLFIGLWNMADDEGRLRGAPMFIRAQIFPYDLDFDVDTALEQLTDNGCIQRYAVDGESFIWVRNFAEHQRIDRPKPSTIPLPPVVDASSKRRRRVVDASSQIVAGREGNGREQGREQGTGSGSTADAASPHESVDPLVAAWAEECPTLPQWREPPDKARKKLIADALARRPLEQWRAVFKRIALSAFLTGQTDGGWKADMEWALRPAGKKPESARKVLEGSFDRGAPGRPKPDVRRGMVMAQDMDHSNTKAGEIIGL